MTSQILKSPKRVLERAKRFAIRRMIGPMLAPFRRGAVVMFHVGRSGSTVLGDLVNQNPWVFWDGEIYNRLINARDRTQRSLDARDDPWEPISELRRCMLATSPRFYGFEVKFFHLRLAHMELETYLEHLRELGITHTILLKRRNLLRKVISSSLAAATNEYHQPASAPPILRTTTLPIDDVKIDGTSTPLLELLRGYNTDFSRLERALDATPYLSLCYEDDVLPDPQIGYAKLVKHLGLKPRRNQIRYGRSNPFSVRDMLENFDEVRSVLAGTEFEWMLDD